MGGLKSRSEDNAFYRHWRNCHETPCEENSVRLENYEFKVEKSYQDPISRQINEMVRISNFHTPYSIQSLEWNAPPIMRIIAQNEKNIQKLNLFAEVI